MKRIDCVMDGYNIHVLKTDRFKQVKILVDLVIPDERYFVCNIPLLSSILMRTNSRYDKINERNLAAYELYGPNYYIDYQIFGSNLVFSLGLTFLNEKYTEKGMNEKIIDFAFNILFNPKVENNSFDEEMLDIIKDEHIHKMETIKERPRSYIIPNLSEHMPLSYYKLLTLDETIDGEKSVTGKSLYECYQRILKEARLEIFVVGDVDSGNIKEIIDSKIPYKPILNDLHSSYIIQKKKEDLEMISEDILERQSLLAVGLVFTDLSFFESNYVFRIYNSILGGSDNSLLNTEAREKRGLCYSIRSSRNDFTGTMIITSAFDGKNYDEMLDIIKEKIEDIKNGQFDEKYIDDFKKSYIDSFNDSEDYIGVSMADMEDEILFGDDSNEDKIKNIKKVTKEDIMALAKRVYIKTVVFLRGSDGYDEKEV